MWLRRHLTWQSSHRWIPRRDLIQAFPAPRARDPRPLSLVTTHDESRLPRSPEHRPPRRVDLELSPPPPAPRDLASAGPAPPRANRRPEPSCSLRLLGREDAGGGGRSSRRAGRSGGIGTCAPCGGGGRALFLGARRRRVGRPRGARRFRSGVRRAGETSARGG